MGDAWIEQNSWNERVRSRPTASWVHQEPRYRFPLVEKYCYRVIINRYPGEVRLCHSKKNTMTITDDIDLAVWRKYLLCSRCTSTQIVFDNTVMAERRSLMKNTHEVTCREHRCLGQTKVRFR